MEESDEDDTPKQEFRQHHQISKMHKEFSSMILDESKIHAPVTSNETHPSKKADAGFFYQSR